MVRHIVDRDAAGNGVDQVLHFLLGFLQSRNIVEHALEQRETAFFPDFFGLDMHPDRMAVLMLLAEFKIRNLIARKRVAQLADDHGRIFGIGYLGGVALDQLVIFPDGVAAQLGHSVGKIDGFKDVGNLVDRHAAGNGVDDVLRLFVRLGEPAFQLMPLGYVGVHAVQQKRPVGLPPGRQLKLNPDVLFFPVVEDAVGVPCDAFARNGRRDACLQGFHIFGMNVQVVGFPLCAGNVLVRVAQEVVKGRIVKDRGKFFAVETVDAQAAGHIVQQRA